MTFTVASSTLRMAGVQSSFPVEESRVSMAPLIMSIPAQECHNREREREKEKETENHIADGV